VAHSYTKRCSIGQRHWQEPLEASHEAHPEIPPSPPLHSPPPSSSPSLPSPPLQARPRQRRACSSRGVPSPPPGTPHTDPRPPPRAVLVRPRAVPCGLTLLLREAVISMKRGRGLPDDPGVVSAPELRSSGSVLLSLPRPLVPLVPFCEREASCRPATCGCWGATLRGEPRPGQGFLQGLVRGAWQGGVIDHHRGRRAPSQHCSRRDALLPEPRDRGRADVAEGVGDDLVSRGLHRASADLAPAVAAARAGARAAASCGGTGPGMCALVLSPQPTCSGGSS